jgi:hypothetical protein
VILSRKPALVYASSGNPGRTYPLSRDPDSLFSAARAAGAKYLLLDHLDQISSTYLVPALIQRPRGFCVIRSLGADRATLFGIVAGADTLKDARPDPGAADVAVSFSQCDDRARAVELHRVNLLVYDRPQAPASCRSGHRCIGISDSRLCRGGSCGSSALGVDGVDDGIPQSLSRIEQALTKSESPSDVLLEDGPLLLAVIAWSVLAVMLVPGG